MVVTNVRMPYSDYTQVKARAGELGMSVNKYFNFLAKDSTRKHMMKKDLPQSAVNKRRALWNALDRIAKIKGKPMGWSKEDEAIYSI